jgi:hypothetical protein
VKTPDQIVHDVQLLLGNDALAAVLDKSLQQAHDRATSELEADLRDVLAWPTTLGARHGITPASRAPGGDPEQPLTPSVSRHVQTAAAHASCG